MNYIDKFDFEKADEVTNQNDFNVVMAMAKKATVRLGTCPAEDVIRGTCSYRYPMIVGINDESREKFSAILKWINGVLKTDTDYENSDKSGNPPLEYKYYSGYINALNGARVPKILRRGGKRTRRKRGKKTKRAKTRRKRR